MGTLKDCLCEFDSKSECKRILLRRFTQPKKVFSKMSSTRLLIVIASLFLVINGTNGNIFRKWYNKHKVKPVKDFIDNLPGSRCTGSTSLYTGSNDPEPAFSFSYTEGDKPNTVNSIDFIGRYYMSKVKGNPRLATSSGNCCWTYFSLPGFRGSQYTLRIGELKQIGFKARSVKIVPCP